MRNWITFYNKLTYFLNFIILNTAVLIRYPPGYSLAIRLRRISLFSEKRNTPYMCYCQMVLTPPTDMINVTSSSYIDGKFNYHNFKHINTMLHRKRYIYLPQTWPLWSVTTPVGAVHYMQLLLQLSREHHSLEGIVRCHNNAIIHIIQRNSLLFIKKYILQYSTLLWISVFQCLIKQLDFVLPSAGVASRQLKLIATVLFVAYSLQNIPS